MRSRSLRVALLPLGAPSWLSPGAVIPAGIQGLGKVPVSHQLSQRATLIELFFFQAPPLFRRRDALL